MNSAALQAEGNPDHREAQAVALDYIKHVTALSTGALVLVATLSDKLLASPSAKWLLSTSIASFVISAAALVLAALGVLRSIRDHESGGHGNITFTSITFILGLISFFGGLFALGLFVILNLP